MTMPTSAEHWFSLALRTLLDCVNMYAVGSAALDEKLTLRRYALFYTLETAVEVAYCLIWDPTYSGAAFLCAILVVALQARFVFGRRGWAFLRATAAMLLAQCAFVAFCAPVGVLLWGAERANAIVVSQGFDRLWQSVLNVVLMPPTCLIIRQARRLALRCREMASDVVYILRSALLLAAAMACGVILINQFAGITCADRIQPIAVSLGAICLIAFVCLSYLIEDFRFLSMRRRNDTLERQRQITEGLIADARHFRHNVLNALYGFEGMLLSGDPALRMRYYRHLASECARINNENILNLQLLNQPELEALVLARIQHANAMNVPLFLTVQQLPRVRKALVAALRQSLPPLVDGAIRMARDSADAHVGLWIGPRDRGVELRVLCTCDGSDAREDASPLPGKPGAEDQPPVARQRRGRFLLQTMVLLP